MPAPHGKVTISEQAYRNDIERLANAALSRVEDNPQLTITEAAREVAPEATTRDDLRSLDGLLRLVYDWTRASTVEISQLREVAAGDNPTVGIDALIGALYEAEIARVARTWNETSQERDVWQHTC